MHRAGLHIHMARLQDLHAGFVLRERHNREIAGVNGVFLLAELEARVSLLIAVQQGFQFASQLRQIESMLERRRLRVVNTKAARARPGHTAHDHRMESHAVLAAVTQHLLYQGNVQLDIGRLALGFPDRRSDLDHSAVESGFKFDLGLARSLQPILNQRVEAVENPFSLFTRTAAAYRLR